VLRSSRACGPWSLRRKSNETAVAEEVEKAARRFDVKIHERATVGTHVHLLVRARQRESLQHFLRVIGGRIAQRVTGARKGRPCPEGFWDEIAYSRLLTWGPDFQNVRRYIEQNLFETMGLVSFGDRPRRRAKGTREGSVCCS
jgi:REP element-mobilizing transposase RayT